MVGWVVLTRPRQINAINDEIRQGVPQALALLQQDPDIRVIVIRGEGERGFCAGADIKERRGPESSLQVRQRMENVRWIETLDGITKPVIAAIHGYCMGGGLELVLACDIRFAAPDAVFALPETGLGLIPGGGGTQRFARMLGPLQALPLLLEGRALGPSQALVSRRPPWPARHRDRGRPAAPAPVRRQGACTSPLDRWRPPAGPNGPRRWPERHPVPCGPTVPAARASPRR